VRTYSFWIKDQKDLKPKDRKVGTVQAENSIDALLNGLRKLNWEKIDVANEISIRDDRYHDETGNHAIVFSVHVGFDPLRDEEV